MDTTRGGTGSFNNYILEIKLNNVTSSLVTAFAANGVTLTSLKTEQDRRAHKVGGDLEVVGDTDVQHVLDTIGWIKQSDSSFIKDGTEGRITIKQISGKSVLSLGAS